MPPLLKKLLNNPVIPEPVDRFYGGYPQHEYARACGLDDRWPLAGGTGY